MKHRAVIFPWPETPQGDGISPLLPFLRLDRDEEVNFEKELSYSSSYFWAGNLGTIVTSVAANTVIIWHKK